MHDNPLLSLSVDSGSAVAPFEQLRVQVRDLVTSGSFAPGARLPTVRQLAAELALAPNTVARTYRELESDGIIETRGRNGSFIASHGDPVEREAQEAAAAYAKRIRSLGFDSDKALSLVAAALGNSQADYGTGVSLGGGATGGTAIEPVISPPPLRERKQ